MPVKADSRLRHLMSIGPGPHLLLSNVFSQKFSITRRLREYLFDLRP